MQYRSHRGRSISAIKRIVRPNRAEKLIVAVLTVRLKKATQCPVHQLRDVVRIFQPETVLSIANWHAVSGRSSAGRKGVARASARSL